MQVVWQVKHCGCSSWFKMKEWVSLVWPICNRDITTCSLLDFLDAGLHSPKVGWIWKSLLWMLLLHCCCHFVWRNLLIVGFRSVYGILDLSGVRSKADLAAESALSFHLTPMWLGVYLGMKMIQPGRSFLKFDSWSNKVFKKYEYVIQIMMSLFFTHINPRSITRSFSRSVMNLKCKIQWHQ